MTGLAFVVFMLVFIDQLFKTWAYNATANGPMPMIENFFYINYIENDGAAFNLFAGSRWVLIGVTAVILAVIAYVIFTKKITNDLIVSGCTMILAGGLGNLIDRITKGFVVDCLDFSAVFGFPVFNFADCCVVIGAMMLIYYYAIVEPRDKKKRLNPPAISEEAKPAGDEV